MRKRVIIVRQITSTDDAGFPQKADETVQCGMADIRPKSAASETDDGRRRSTSTVECRIRCAKKARLESGMTLIVDQRRYTIQSADDVGGHHMWWLISATEEAVQNG